MPHYIFESRVLKTMAGPVCGVDEAGRGPLAGPVVAAAVIFERKRIPKGLNDSKQMTPEVTRDRMMVALHEQFPGYGWVTNKGYSTEGHVEALNRLGPCHHHRRSFAPVHRLLYPDASEAELAALVQPEPIGEAA